MPSLLDNLTSSFGSDGFDFETAFSNLGGALTAVAPSGVSLDQAALGSITSGLGSGGFGAIGTTVSSVLQQAGGLSGSIAAPASLVQPLTGAFAGASSFATADPRSLLQLLEDAAATGDGTQGLAALAGPLSALSAVRSSPLVASALQLFATLVPGGLQIERTITAAGDSAGGVVALVRLLGALMSTDALTREIGSTAASIQVMLDAPSAQAAVTQLRAPNAAHLPQLIADADPNDPDAVAAVAQPVAVYAGGIRSAADRLVRGLAFGEATLVGADLDTVGQGLTQASQLLVESDLAPVHELAADVAAKLDPLLRIDLGAPAASLDAFLAEIDGLVGRLGTAVGSIDPATLARPVTNALTTVLAPLHEVENVANQATAAIRSAFQTAQQLIASIDLRPVTDAIHTAVQPVVDALHELETLIGEAEAELQTLAEDVTAALNTVRTTLDGAAATIHGAFANVKQTIDDLHLENLEQTLEQDLKSVASTLESAQVQPYFDTAIDALNTAKSVIAAVPISLLPDDTRKELDDAVKPIKDIDFDTEVRDVLENALDEIMTALDTDVLDEIDEAFHEVLAFIQGIDPRARLQQFEQEDFDPMLERIRAVDPTEVLKPISDVIDQVKAAIADIDLRHDVLGPLEDAFTQVEQAFADLDPAALLAPVEQALGQLRQQIVNALGLDTWTARLALVDPFVTTLLGRLDFDTVVALLDAAWGELEPSPEPSGTSALGTIVSGLLAGTGLTLRMDSFGTVTRWIGGADASAEVAGRLEAAAAGIESTAAVVQRVDPQALVAAAQPGYAAVVAAVQALPEGSLLRGRLEPLLAGASPLDLLGTTVDNRNRYLASLTALAGSLRALAASARGEVNAIARGLRDALRPLLVVGDRVKMVFARVGFDVVNKSLRQLVRELFERVKPSRVLAPLSSAIAALKTKVAALIHDGLVAPLQDALATIQAAIDALDISFIRTSLQELHDQIAADIHQLRPSVLLADVLDAFDETKQTIAAFDPLGPVRTAIDEMKAAIDDVAAHYRPTVLFAPLLDVYDEVVQALGSLDVRTLLDPVLKALEDIKTQLDNGLDGTAAALKQLQAALP